MGIFKSEVYCYIITSEQLWYCTHVGTTYDNQHNGSICSSRANMYIACDDRAHTELFFVPLPYIGHMIVPSAPFAWAYNYVFHTPRLAIGSPLMNQ
jgi:hypothetical protein